MGSGDACSVLSLPVDANKFGAEMTSWSVRLPSGTHSHINTSVMLLRIEISTETTSAKTSVLAAEPTKRLGDVL